MEEIVVVGSSGHAKVVVDIIERQSIYSIVGLIDCFKDPGPTLIGYPILGSVANLARIAATCQVKAGIVAIGDNWERAKVVSQIGRLIPEFKFIVAIHPSAQMGRDVSIGAGTVVMAGTVINSGSIFGQHCVINTKASVDHDNVIGDFVSLAPNSTTGGNVRIDRYIAVGLGANVIHRISIGEHTVIGAGSTVLKDIPSFVVAFGSPAIVRRKRAAGEKYL